MGGSECAASRYLRLFALLCVTARYGLVMGDEQNDTDETKADLGTVLFTLATNLLLYVVLIIVFVMLAYFYFEDNPQPYDSGYAVVHTELEAINESDQLEMEDGKGIEDSEFSEESATPSPRRTSLRRGVSSRSFLDFNNWEDTSGTKEEVLQRLAICAVGLNVCFVAWGLLQERMLTQPYDGEYFTYSYGLVFTNRLQALILSGFLMYYYQLPWPEHSITHLYEFSFPSVSNMLSSWCQYEALKYVTFPTQVLSKSFKILPTMLMGNFLHDKRYEAWEYSIAMMIGFGIWIFLASSENLGLGVSVTGDLGGQNGAVCGLVLLLLYLFFDSFTGQYQSRMFMQDKTISPVAMMVMINAFSTVFSFITLIHTEELTPAFDFVYQHPQIHVHFLLFSIFSTIGQIFIFYTMKNFGAVVFAIIMTVRILLSIVFSCLIYDHPITELGYLGMFIVFGAVGYRIKKKTEGKNILKWEGMHSSQGQEMLHEMHEHIDM